MDNIILILISLLLPYIATVLGVFIAIYIDNPQKKTEEIMLGFAAGVMLAASIWGLLLPAFDSINLENGFDWLIVTLSIAFMLGIGCILLLDKILPHIHTASGVVDGKPSKLPRSFLLVFAVALHNLPEGLAMGVVLGAMLFGETIGVGAVLAMSIGLALQNFPEGMAVTFPLIKEGLTKKKAFIFGQLSSLAEPVCAILGIFLAASLEPIMPLLLTFAAGCMIFIVVEELIPESQTGESHAGTYGLLGGFWLMIVLSLVIG